MDPIKQMNATTLVAKIEERNQLAHAKMDAEKGILRDFVIHWPDSRLITNIHHNTISPATLGQVSVRAMVADRSAAIEYLSAFQCEPLLYLRNPGTSTVKAKAWLDEGYEENYETIIDCLSAYWAYDDYEHAMLHAYATVGQVRTHIRIKIMGDPAFRSVQRDSEHYSQRIAAWKLSNAPGGEAVKFSSGSATTAGLVMIYFPEEPGGAAPDLAYYLDLSRPVEWRSGH